MDDIVCEYPSERGDLTVCGFQAESIVDIVRSEGDGSSTFFTMPMCIGHRLALGEHVVAFQPMNNGEEARRG